MDQEQLISWAKTEAERLRNVARARTASPGDIAPAIPDRKTDVVETIGEGNKVMARVHTTGTKKGGVAWIGVPQANDAKIDFEWISIFEFDKDGKIIKHYGLNDAYTLGIQLGAIAPPAMG